MSALALLTIRGVVGRKLFRGAALLMVLGLVLAGLAFSAIARSGPDTFGNVASILSQASVLVTMMFTFVLGATGVFMTVGTIHREIESGQVLAVLARPLRRSQFLLGKWLGYALLLAALALLAMGLGFAIFGLAAGYQPAHPWSAVAFVAAQSIALVSFALLLATRLPPVVAGAGAVATFGLAWFVGILGKFGQIYGVAALQSMASVTSYLFPTDGLWRGAAFNLESAEFVAIMHARGAEREPVGIFFAPEPQPILAIAWAVAWTLVVLGAAVLSFRRREL